MISLNALFADLPAKGDLVDAPVPWYAGFGFWDYAMIVLLLVGVGYLFRYRPAIAKFVGEVKVELDKCSWPWDPNQTGFKKYKELIESTVVVVISVVLLAGFVTSCDFLLTHLVGFLTGTGLAQAAVTAPVSPVH